MIIFGRFPYEEQWRPAVATILLIAALVISAIPAFWNKVMARYLLWVWVIAFFGFFTLMKGGIFELTPISTDMWGGFPLTVVLTLFGMGISIPLGVILAIGRRSSMPIVSGISTGYIELVRGIPLITVLFMATFIFPLLLPAGTRMDAFWRVTIAIVLFQALIWQKRFAEGFKRFLRGNFMLRSLWGSTRWKHIFM